MNAHKKAIEPHNRYKKRICVEERESVPVVKRRAEGGV